MQTILHSSSMRVVLFITKLEKRHVSMGARNQSPTHKNWLPTPIIFAETYKKYSPTLSINTQNAGIIFLFISSGS